MVNKSDRLFPFDRLNIPVPSLDLYVDDAGVLWTEDIKVVYDQGQMATIQLSGQSPAEANSAILVSPARRSAPKSILVRAVQQLRSEL